MKTKHFNKSLIARYETLERNIKSKSNSFYDSYLDMLEETIKYILRREKIEFDDTRTCGFIVRNSLVEDFFKNEIKVDDFTYNKLPDYIKKCNDHKHKKEKNIQIEGIINFLTVYYTFVNYYKKYIQEDKILFDSNYYVSIFGITEILNKKYKKEVVSLKEELEELYTSQRMSSNDLEEYKSLLSNKELEVLNLDEQNQVLQTQINKLKTIKLHTLEEKLNKSLELLLNLQDEVIENRLATDVVYRSITGKGIKTAVENLKKKGNED